MSAATQRGTAVATATAPTSSVFIIAASTFRYQPFAKQESIEDESTNDITEIFNGAGHRVSFTGTLKSGQTRKVLGDLLALTYDGASVVTYVIESADQEGFGMGLKQQITAKKADAATYT
jgi:hypothetical protein